MNALGTRSLRGRRTAAVGLAALSLILTGCAGNLTGGDDNPGAHDGTVKQVDATPKESAAQVQASIPASARDIAVNRTVRLDVTAGTFRNVRVVGKDGPLAGAFSPDRTSWHSTARLQPGETYRIHSVAVDGEGLTKQFRSHFATDALTLDEQTYPSFVPVEGSTVGVGMPVIIRFDVAVTDKASIERHLHVSTKPAQPGAFYWISDHEVHWRPKTYWQPGTQVTVDADVDSVPAGDGVWGQMSRTNHFTIGRSMISKVNMDTHQMQVFENGQLIRTIPITTGEEPKYTTRSGVKVIVEKFRHKRMNSETIGIDPDSAEGYDLDDVEYAMRITYSGEFIHAAPWSVSSQGNTNVSHGCTGLSTANAGWLYNRSIVGDVVEYTGTQRDMTLTNGFGDWNLSFADYREGSALH
ncbi:MAG TPA: Ig-like domain-containing protein [Marmoricola sp.]|nr:Ig-like domain-containing protein [Marmoricola sp.]